MENISVGIITSIQGIKVKGLVLPKFNKSSYLYNGQIFRGISINEYILIRRGYTDIVGKIEGEFLEERRDFTQDKSPYEKYDRFVDIQLLGYLEDGQFHQGIKYMPMIEDQIYLITNEQIKSVLTFLPKTIHATPIYTIDIGKTLLEELPVEIPINGVYNSHIGIFGNTGSGKSNTLAKLYVDLFQKRLPNSKSFLQNSQFLVIDFGGEYQNFVKVCNDIKPDSAKYLQLNTNTSEAQDKLQISNDIFWDAEFLSVLFSATEKTQKPFLQYLVNGREKYSSDNSLTSYFHHTLSNMFGTNQHKETVNLLRKILPLIGFKENLGIIDNVEWFTKGDKYIISGGFINNIDDFYKQIPILKDYKISQEQPTFDELMIRAVLQLINSVSSNYVQYDHINPLINKIETSLKSLEKIIQVGTDGTNIINFLNVISLRNCNTEMKKTVSMLLAKIHFQEHKNKLTGDDTQPSKTFHFVIDEAHNILSDTSFREAESWKDYRLELFEEIIKEGRKFGFFVTIASQRPADISPTIISQLHNYFLHRLVNENDLFLLKNTISTLDASSRSQIPSLPPGGCIISGTAFHFPVLVQIEKLAQESAPDSETINLDKLWEDSNDEH